MLWELATNEDAPFAGFKIKLGGGGEGWVEIKVLAVRARAHARWQRSCGGKAQGSRIWATALLLRKRDSGCNYCSRSFATPIAICKSIWTNNSGQADASDKSRGLVTRDKALHATVCLSVRPSVRRSCLYAAVIRNGPFTSRLLSVSNVVYLFSDKVDYHSLYLLYWSIT